MTASRDHSDQLKLKRRTILRSAATVSAAGFVGLPAFAGVAAGIETCETDLDIVLAIDYSGSINSAGTWSDINSGAKDFIDELADDNQIGLVTFGDTAKAYDFGDRDYLQKAADGSDNRPAIKSTIPGSSPPQENATHMAAAIDLANDILDEQGRGGSEVIVLLTDGEPNYQNGTIGDGVSPPADESDDTVGGVSGWDPSGTTTATIFDPDGDGTANTYTYDGGTATENATITDSERDETAERAAAARGDSQYETQTGDTKSVTPSDPTRILTVGIGAGADANYLKTHVATAESDHTQTSADQIGDELVELLEELCCIDCPDSFSYKYEWVEEEGDEEPTEEHGTRGRGPGKGNNGDDDDEEEEESSSGECAGKFVIYNDDDTPVEGSLDEIELVSVTCDGDGEPSEACFETTLCELQYEVKAGRNSKTESVSFKETEGTFCVTGITDTNPAGKDVTYAISNIQFSCPEN